MEYLRNNNTPMQQVNIFNLFMGIRLYVVEPSLVVENAQNRNGMCKTLVMQLLAAGDISWDGTPIVASIPVKVFCWSFPSPSHKVPFQSSGNSLTYVKTNFCLG